MSRPSIDKYAFQSYSASAWRCASEGLRVIISEIAMGDRQVWVRAFYGFDPENGGYIGYTYEKSREKMLARMKDGDLVLIYGAVDDLTRPDQKSQALGFLEVTTELCMDTERMSQSAIDWRVEHNRQHRWRYGMKVRRAWRVLHRVGIKNLAPDAYQNVHRFERSSTAMLLNADDRRRVLSLMVRQVNVFGEPPISEVDLAEGQMERLLKPSVGPVPTFGSKTSQSEDGDTFLYLMILSQNAESLFGHSTTHTGKALVKVGRTNDPARREKDLNVGFPERSAIRWKLTHRQKFEDAMTAHNHEIEIKKLFEQKFRSEGGEFFIGERRDIESFFTAFCISKMPKILGAAGKAKGVR